MILFCGNAILQPPAPPVWSASLRCMLLSRHPPTLVGTEVQYVAKGSHLSNIRRACLHPVCTQYLRVGHTSHEHVRKLPAHLVGSLYEVFMKKRTEKLETSVLLQFHIGTYQIVASFAISSFTMDTAAGVAQAATENVVDAGRRAGKDKAMETYLPAEINRARNMVSFRLVCVLPAR